MADEAYTLRKVTRATFEGKQSLESDAVYFISEGNDTISLVVTSKTGTPHLLKTGIDINIGNPENGLEWDSETETLKLNPATTTKAGALSSADKKKIDDIVAGNGHTYTFPEKSGTVALIDDLFSNASTVNPIKQNREYEDFITLENLINKPYVTQGEDQYGKYLEINGANQGDTVNLLDTSVDAFLREGDADLFWRFRRITPLGTEPSHIYMEYQSGYGQSSGKLYGNNQDVPTPVSMKSVFGGGNYLEKINLIYTGDIFRLYNLTAMARPWQGDYHLMPNDSELYYTNWGNQNNYVSVKFLIDNF